MVADPAGEVAPPLEADRLHEVDLMARVGKLAKRTLTRDTWKSAHLPKELTKVKIMTRYSEPSTEGPGMKVSRTAPAAMVTMETPMAGRRPQRSAMMAMRMEPRQEPRPETTWKTIRPDQYLLHTRLNSVTTDLFFLTSSL